MFLEESAFICPLCKQKLFKVNNSLKCLGSHSFDFAKQGYVNLLMSNASGKRHGDDRLMVEARSRFLNKGYYDALRQTASTILGADNIVLDAGCGEGYYTSLFEYKNNVIGIDISKDALKLASRKCQNSQFAVASISDIPIANESVDAVINIFAPDSPNEFMRVLKSDGRLIMVYPMEKHLIELKAAVYDKPYLNPEVNLKREDMKLISQKELKYTALLDCNEDILSLFKMTPYYYKTSREDQQKLENINKLDVSLEFIIAEYQK